MRSTDFGQKHGKYIQKNRPNETVKTYNYLGSFFNENIDGYQVIKNRFEKARNTFIELKPVPWSRNLCLEVR